MRALSLEATLPPPGLDRKKRFSFPEVSPLSPPVIVVQGIAHAVKAGPEARKKVWLGQKILLIFRKGQNLFTMHLPVAGPMRVVRSELPNRVFSAAPTRLLRASIKSGWAETGRFSDAFNSLTV